MKPIQKTYILHDSRDIKKRQNHGPSEKIRLWGGKEEGIGRAQKIFRAGKSFRMIP